MVVTVPEYCGRIVPKEQSFEADQYAGIFRFRFWYCGEWLEVVVDDRLPVVSDDWWPDFENTLLYCHNSKDENDMMAPLLEKAYAKLNGCYEFLDGGDPIEAMIDMTGGKLTHLGLNISDFIVILFLCVINIGVHEEYLTKSKYKSQKLSPKIMWEVIFKSLEMKSLVSVSTAPETSDEATKYGISSGHAYSVLDVFELISSGENELYSELRKSFDDKQEGNKIKLLK